MSSCHNCGLPEGTDGQKGRSIQITLKPENGFQRQRKVTVWCCSDECAVQALGLAKWGPSHKWPVSLAKFRSTVKFDPLPQLSPLHAKFASGKGWSPAAKRTS